MQVVQETQQKVKDNSLNGQILRNFFNLLNVLPALWVGFFLSFVLATWLEVGHLPLYSNPDPKDTILAWLFMPLVYAFLPLAVASVPAWSVLAGMASLKLIPVKLKLHNLLLIVFPILLFFLIRFQTGLFDWLMD